MQPAPYQAAPGPNLNARPDGGTVPVTCPGCGRTFPLPPDELSQTTECASCNRIFVPGDYAVMPPLGKTGAWQPYLLGVVAILCGALALLAAIVLSSKPLGVILAGFGIVFGLSAVASSLAKRGTGLGFSTLSIVGCGIALFAAILVAGSRGGSRSSQQDRQAGASGLEKDARKDKARREKENDSASRNGPKPRAGGDAGRDAKKPGKDGEPARRDKPKPDLGPDSPKSKPKPDVEPDSPKGKPKPDAGADGPKTSPIAALKPGQAIDEKKVRVPTKSRFNSKNVHETAEWVIGRTLEVQQHGDNAFRAKTELQKFNQQMRACVGQRVEWRFTVESILEDRIRFHQTWKTYDGSRYPDFDGLFPRRGLIVLPRFRVVFYHEGNELFDPTMGAPGGWGLRDSKREPNGLARFVWEDEGLTIGDEIDTARALRLSPNDVITVKAKIKAFKMVADLSPAFPSNCAVCILEADRTEEWKREEAKRQERRRQEQERVEGERRAREERDRKERERLAREAREEAKRERAKEIAHYWGAVEEWQAEKQRTGKEPSGQWQRAWQEKWAPIKIPYPEVAMKELQEEERRTGKIASKEWLKKWREKWDYPDP
jgi:hypothetical protein